MQLSAKSKGIAGVLAALTILGVCAWIYQLMNGLGVTGMNNATSWGLYITCFMFFVGLSAGGLIVASSASVFHIEKFKPVALPAVILSTVCITLAAMFVLIDLGSIQNIYYLVISGNFSSPLMWDVCVITCYLIINILYLYFMTVKKEAKRALAITSRFALPVAILVHSVTAWIFGLQIASEGWYSAIMAPIFVASAMDSGLALLLIALVVLSGAKLIKLEKGLLPSLAGLLAVCIAVDAFLIGCELLTMAYPGGEGGEYFALITSGSTSMFFWFEMVVGLLIPFCMLVFAKVRENTNLVMVASVCVIAGVFCKRVWLLFTSFLTYNIEGAPGLTIGQNSTLQASDSIWTLGGVYCPTMIEIAVVVGVISLGALAFMLLSKALIKSES